MAKKKQDKQDAVEQTPDTQTPDTQTPDTQTPDTQTPDKETREIATREQVEPVLAQYGLDDDYTGYDEFGQEDFIVPRVKIVQPSSKEGIPGTFRVNLTGETFEEINIVGIKVERGRVLWDDDNMEKPVCRSYDFLNPDPAIQSPISPQCAQRDPHKKIRTLCPKARWGADHARPECNEIYNLLAYAPDAGIPFWLSIGGTSIAPIKRFVSSIALRGKKLFEFQTECSLKEETGTKGRYYILQFSPPEKLEVEKLLELAPTIARLKDLTFQRTIELEEATQDDPIPEQPEGDTDLATENVPDWVNE